MEKEILARGNKYSSTAGHTLHVKLDFSLPDSLLKKAAGVTQDYTATLCVKRMANAAVMDRKSSPSG